MHLGNKDPPLAIGKKSTNKTRMIDVEHLNMSVQNKVQILNRRNALHMWDHEWWNEEKNSEEKGG